MHNDIQYNFLILRFSNEDWRVMVCVHKHFEILVFVYHFEYSHIYHMQYKYVSDKHVQTHY